MKLKLTKAWYEARSEAEKKCMDATAGKALTSEDKKTTSSKSKRSSAARAARRTPTASKVRRAK